MRKVTTINLNGKAYQLEEQGYEALQKYLHKAETALADDPDKAEVIADIEQAIADKCDRMLKDGKNVVTVEQITDVLDQMGAVEGETTTEHETKAEPKNTKRLFTIREGSVILGVCKGIGAYLDVEPNIVRALFIILTIITHGFGILLYIALAIFLPHAKTDSQLAEAYGEPTRAQDIVDRARERATDPETIRNISNGVVRIFRIAMQIVGIGMAILFGILTFAWLWVLWLLLLGRLHLQGQLQILNGWRELLIITLAYLIVALPVFLIFRGFDRLSENRRQTRISTVSETTLGVLWGVAVLGMVAFATTYVGNVRDYVHTHQGGIDVGRDRLCIDHSVCGNNLEDRRFYHVY
jgi:phage shock protein PspC (stress-responsive transcriptional regulator)